jgi:hypothetical protein
MRTIARSVAVMLGAGLLLTVALAGAAAAADPSGDQPVVVLTGWIDIAADQRVDDAVIFDGDLTNDGVIDGNAVAFNGDVVIRGTVVGDAVALNGHVIVEDGAEVDGDVVSRLAPTIAPNTVHGQVLRNEFRTEGVLLIGRIAFWIAASVSSLILGLLLIALTPRGGEAAAEAARRRLGPSIGWGLLLFVGIPILGAIALATLVGALFGAAVLLSTVLLYSVAYAVGALALGRLILGPPKKLVLAFLLAWAILRVLALVPVVGGLLFVVAAVWGFGGLIVAGTRAGRSSGTPEIVAAPPAGSPVPPPPPPMP